MSDKKAPVEATPFAGKYTEEGIIEEFIMKLKLNHQKLFAGHTLFSEHLGRIEDRLRGTPHDLRLNEIYATVFLEILESDSVTISVWERFYELMMERMRMRDDAREIARVIFETSVEVLTEVDPKKYKSQPDLVQAVRFLQDFREHLSVGPMIH